MKVAISGLKYYDWDKNIIKPLMKNNLTIQIRRYFNADYTFDK